MRRWRSPTSSLSELFTSPPPTPSPLLSLLHSSTSTSRASSSSSPPPRHDPRSRSRSRKPPSGDHHSNSPNPPTAADFPTELDSPAVLEALSSYANDWARALEFFHWAEAERGFRHTLDTYDRAIDILGKFFEFGRAWGLVRRMGSPGHSTFRVLFKRYAAAHLVQEAADAFERSAEFGLRDRTGFHNLVDAWVHNETFLVERQKEYNGGTKSCSSSCVETKHLTACSNSSGTPKPPLWIWVGRRN